MGRAQGQGEPMTADQIAAKLRLIRGLRCAEEVQGYRDGARLSGRRLSPEEVRELAERERQVRK